jgi:hypothetical protein
LDSEGGRVALTLSIQPDGDLSTEELLMLQRELQERLEAVGVSPEPLQADRPPPGAKVVDGFVIGSMVIKYAGPILAEKLAHEVYDWLRSQLAERRVRIEARQGDKKLFEMDGRASQKDVQEMAGKVQETFAGHSRVERRAALIIGNMEHDDAALSQLSAPTQDAESLGRILRDPRIGSFDEVEVLTNQRAATVMQAIERFYSRRTSQDLLFLYFSGHGILDRRRNLYLAAKDTQHDLLRSTGVPVDFIRREMDGSPSQSQVLVLDCCYSGAVLTGAKAATAIGEHVDVEMALRGSGAGRAILTASDSTQFAWEGDRVVGTMNRSLFTHFLVEGLESGEADTDGDGTITLDEWYRYAHDRVISHQADQTPTKSIIGQRGELIIARNPRPKPAYQIPDELVKAMRSTLPSMRMAAALEFGRWVGSENPARARAGRESLEYLTHDLDEDVAATAREALGLTVATPPDPPKPKPVPPRPDPLPQPTPPDPSAVKMGPVLGLAALTFLVPLAGLVIILSHRGKSDPYSKTVVNWTIGAIVAWLVVFFCALSLGG